LKGMSLKMKTISKIIKEHFEYKNQITKLAKADLVKTYRGAALGWMWAIIKPTVTIFVYWFAFTVGLRAGQDVKGFPYFLWLISGVIPWTYMSEMITAGTDCIRKYSYLVTKMKFPVATIPTFVNMSKFSVHIILMAIVIWIFAIFGFLPQIYILQLPIYMLLTFIFFNIWGLFSSLLAAISKDYANLVKSFISALFWLSGIMWNVDTIQNSVIRNILKLNPITFLVNGYRNCFINKTWFWNEPLELLYFAVILGILLVFALVVYRKLRKDIPDVL